MNTWGYKNKREHSTKGGGIDERNKTHLPTGVVASGDKYNTKGDKERGDTHLPAEVPLPQPD